MLIATVIKARLFKFLLSQDLRPGECKQALTQIALIRGAGGDGCFQSKDLAGLLSAVKVSVAQPVFWFSNAML